VRLPSVDVVEAVQFARKMAGRAQAHLVRASDEHHYVVKFCNNPQGRRIPVNEWIASQLLQFSGILAPQTAAVRIVPDFLEANPNVHLGWRDERVPVEPGLHFGSRYPGDPATTAVYDFLPDSLLAQTANLDQFRGILAYDKWLGNTDGRQCVFYRAKAAPDRDGSRWVASMIDNGLAFNGPHWNFPDSPIQAVYCRRAVYETVRSLDDFQPWLDQVVSFPEIVIQNAGEAIPVECGDRDRDELKRLLDRLCQRRERVPALLRECCEGAPRSFPFWSPATIHPIPEQVDALTFRLIGRIGGFLLSSKPVLKRMHVSPRHSLVPIFGLIT